MELKQAGDRLLPRKTRQQEDVRTQRRGDLENPFFLRENSVHVLPPFFRPAARIVPSVDALRRPPAAFSYTRTRRLFQCSRVWRPNAAAPPCRPESAARPPAEGCWLRYCPRCARRSPPPCSGVPPLPPVDRRMSAEFCDSRTAGAEF